MSETVIRSASMPATAEDSVEPVDHPGGAAPPLKITGEQTIRTVDQLHKALAEHLARGPAVVVDLSEVDECDTTALQLIYALRQSAVERELRFHITAISPAIAETAAALGLRIEALTAGCGPEAADGDCEVAGIDHGI